MTRRGAAQRQPLGERIGAFLRQRGEPASSRMLTERFLNAAVNSEEIATRLLRPVLEAMGAVYRDGEGWVLDGGVSAQGAAPSPLFAAVFDAARVHLVEVGGDRDPQTWLPGTALPADAALIVLEPRLHAGAIRDWLRSQHQPGSVAIRSLRSVVRGVVRVRRDADLSEICAALGVRWLDTQDPAGTAVAIAACVGEALLRRHPKEEIEVAQTGVTSGMLDALPESPGVYRFHDADGRLLYVGKASNLKRRVSSYFTPAATRRPRRFQGRIHTMTYEVVGSELEALLREDRLIVRRAPSGNVQTRIHERGARYEATRVFAVLLPEARACAVSVILVRHGNYVGHARIGPRGGGLTQARRLLGRAICAKRARPRSSGKIDRDTAILRTWLARNGASASRIDLDGFTRADQAGAALAVAVKELLAEPGRVIFR